MASTLADVARHAGVSESTVSRVVRGVPVVTERVRLRVEASIRALDYRPNVAARSIRTGTTHAIGFVVPDILNSFYAMIFEGAQSVLHDAGYELILATSHGEVERERIAIDSLRARRVDGLILSLVQENRMDLAASIGGTPAILLDRESNVTDSDRVLADHRSGVTAAVEHLVALGHRRIALLAGDTRLYTARSRRAAFLEAAWSAGLDPNDLNDLSGDRSVAAGSAKAARLLAMDEPPTAVIAGSNQLLRGVLVALNESGLRCPEEISIVACDDGDVCQIYRPPISVVRRDVDAMGRVVAQRLLLRLTSPETRDGAQEAEPRVEIVPTEFVDRGSTALPRGPAQR